MLVAASHISAPPYLAVTVGPSNHSPPPIAEAAITTPGPIIAKIFRQPTMGTGGSSPVSQRGIDAEPGCGAVNVADVAAVGSAEEASWDMRRGNGREEVERGGVSMPVRSPQFNDSQPTTALRFLQSVQSSWRILNTHLRRARIW